MFKIVSAKQGVYIIGQLELVAGSYLEGKGWIKTPFGWQHPTETLPDECLTTETAMGIQEVLEEKR